MFYYRICEAKVIMIDHSYDNINFYTNEELNFALPK